jgi:hypothetical protein
MEGHAVFLLPPLSTFRVLAFETPAVANPGTTLLRAELFVGLQRRGHEEAYRRHRSCAPVRLGLCPEHRPAPQAGMEKPGATNGAKSDGSMDTTGMSATKGNVKRDKGGAPAPKDEKK